LLGRSWGETKSVAYPGSTASAAFFRRARETVASSRPSGIGGLRNAGRQAAVAGGNVFRPAMSAPRCPRPGLSPGVSRAGVERTCQRPDAAPYMAIVARHIAPKAPPKAELPPGIAMDALTMSEFMDLEDSWSTAAGSSLVSSR